MIIHCVNCVKYLSRDTFVPSFKPLSTEQVKKNAIKMLAQLQDVAPTRLAALVLGGLMASLFFYVGRTASDLEIATSLFSS